MTDRRAAALKAWDTIRRKKELKRTVERTKLRLAQQQQEAKIKDFSKENFSLFTINEEVIYDNKRTVITAIQDDHIQVRGSAKWIHVDEVAEL